MSKLISTDATGLASRRSSPTGVPAQKSMANRIPTKAMAVPRSGCSITSPSGAATTMPGPSRSCRFCGPSSRLASSRASARMVAILAISEGWKRMGPMAIQLSMPAAVPAPVPTTSVAASSTSDSTYAGMAAHSNQRRRTRASTVNTASEIANQRAWRSQAFCTTSLGRTTTPAE